MLAKNNLPKTIPAKVRQAMGVFSSEELNQIQAFVSQKTGRLRGLGFGVKDGAIVKPTGRKKLAALAVMEKQYQKELDQKLRLWRDIERRVNVIVKEMFDGKNSPAPSGAPASEA